MEGISAAIRSLLIAIGEDPDREGLCDTPARFARSYVSRASRAAEYPC
jgi:GTP cyclohydrolase I